MAFTPEEAKRAIRCQSCGCAPRDIEAEELAKFADRQGAVCIEQVEWLCPACPDPPRPS